jgi:hypothetical protein
MSENRIAVDCLTYTEGGGIGGGPEVEIVKYEYWCEDCLKRFGTDFEAYNHTCVPLYVAE